MRRAVDQPTPPERVSPPRACSLDPWRDQITQWLRDDSKLLTVDSWAALNATLLTELEADLPTRHLDDGRSAEEALALERQHLRAMPKHLPATCRVVARVADKFGHVRVEHITYSVPIRHAYQPVWVKLYHDRVAIAVGADVVAEHGRAFCRGTKVLDPFHVLPLLERKHRAVAEATALLDWLLAPV